MNKKYLLYLCGDSYANAAKILGFCVGHIYNMPATLSGRRLASVQMRLRASGIKYSEADEKKFLDKCN